MAEVELMDHDRGPREFDEGIIMVNEFQKSLCVKFLKLLNSMADF
jgi:hypothetical protein